MSTEKPLVRCDICEGHGKVTDDGYFVPWCTKSDVLIYEDDKTGIGVTHPMRCPKCKGAGVIPSIMFGVTPGPTPKN